MLARGIRPFTAVLRHFDIDAETAQAGNSDSIQNQTPLSCKFQPDKMCRVRILVKLYSRGRSELASGINRPDLRHQLRSDLIYITAAKDPR